jgi:hypothetical protein
VQGQESELFSEGSLQRLKRRCPERIGPPDSVKFKYGEDMAKKNKANFVQKTATKNHPTNKQTNNAMLFARSEKTKTTHNSRKVK